MNLDIPAFEKGKCAPTETLFRRSPVPKKAKKMTPHPNAESNSGWAQRCVLWFIHYVERKKVPYNRKSVVPKKVKMMMPCPILNVTAAGWGVAVCGSAHYVKREEGALHQKEYSA